MYPSHLSASMLEWRVRNVSVSPFGCVRVTISTVHRCGPSGLSQEYLGISHRKVFYSTFLLCMVHKLVRVSSIAKIIFAIHM